ncbi:putative quinol monooxygenase [Pseudomonas kurunegalensis]|uniref:putative quinol monooxygenase n=1 Tax=Pseudomonas kurunegalensis TaxID=485880 RepID=UPI003556B20B
MSKQVIFTLSLKVSPSNIAALLKIVQQLVADTEQEEGSLTYEYFASEDESTIFIHERYVDSAAAIFHLTHTFPPYAESFAKFTETESFFIHGDASPKLKETLKEAQVVYLKPFAGFDRH